MADPQKITSTFSIDLKPIGALQERDHTRLSDCLLQEAGPHVAALLAEPVTNRDGSRTDWYTRRQGRAVALEKLSEEEVANLRDRLSQIETEIDALAVRYAASSNADDRHLSQALLNCLSVPSDSYIYSVGGEPVLTAWGYTLASKPGYRGGLAKIAPVKPAATDQGAGARYVQAEAEAALEPEVANKEKPRNGCLPAMLWLLFALLVASILIVLLRACAFNISIPWINAGFCNSTGVMSTIGELQHEMADLEKRLLTRRDECAATGLAFINPGDLPQSSTPLSQQEIDGRLADRQGQAGSLQISLVWNGLSDLDLSVNCGKEQISFRQKSACGGILDVDSNFAPNITPRPVENIYWTNEADIPSGELPITVTFFRAGDGEQAAVPYTLRIQRRNGSQVLSDKSIKGSVAPNAAVKAGDANQ